MGSLCPGSIRLTFALSFQASAHLEKASFQVSKISNTPFSSVFVKTESSQSQCLSSVSILSENFIRLPCLLLPGSCRAHGVAGLGRPSIQSSTTQARARGLGMRG